MSDYKPPLDPAPAGKPHDFSYRAIKLQKAKVPTAPAAIIPDEWHNPNQKYLAHRGQKNGGTCTGQAAAYGKRHDYIKLTGDIPTSDQMAQLKRNVIDSLGSLVDILPPGEFSSECAYQMGRDAGNVTYPAGGDIRFVARAMRDYGIVLESMWHSDKERNCVWMYPPGARKTADGGVTPEEAAEFAALHRIKGWAMVGTPDGDASWDEIRAAIYEKGWVMCAIPIYTNFMEMQGQEHPIYPYPNGELDGFHAQIVDGYTLSKLDIEHSWYGFCGQHGDLPKEYYNYARDLCVWLVWLDDEEVLIGKTLYSSCEITCDVPAQVIVDGVVIGNSPQKIAIEKGRSYLVTVKAEGYISEVRMVDENTKEIKFVLEPITPEPVKKTWIQALIDWILKLFRRT